MKNKLSKVFALAVVLAVGLWGGGALATELVYTPVNPSFGGNPLNGSYLLNNAQAQNNQKDPAAVEEEKSDLEQFADSLRQRILSTISQRIAYDMLGEEGLPTGSYMVGDFQLNVEDNLDSVVIRLEDTSTGEQTEIHVPQF